MGEKEQAKNLGLSFLVSNAVNKCLVNLINRKLPTGIQTLKEGPLSEKILRFDDYNYANFFLTQDPQNLGLSKQLLREIKKDYNI